MFKQGVSRPAASRGSDVENLHQLQNVVDFDDYSAIFKQGVGRGAAPRGADFRIMINSKQGSSKGPASGGSDF